jgi:hypothetical protein
VAGRRRTLLFLCALGFAAVLAPASVAAARPAQDPAFGGAGATTTTATVVTSTTEATAETNSTLVESEDSPDQPLFTENRKVAAVIGSLLLVAFAILLLTIRYVRVTKPSSSASVEPGFPMLPIDLDINDDSIFTEDPIGRIPARKAIDPTAPVSAGADGAEVAEVAGVAGVAEEPGEGTVADEASTPDQRPVAAVGAEAPGTDHDAADEDWEPHTDEHQRVEIPSGTTLARPGSAARRRALGVDPD